MPSGFLAGILGVVLAAGAVQPAAAQPPPEGVEFSLGAGAIVSARPYHGADSEITVLPLIGVRYKTFFFEGVRTGFRGSPVEHLELSAFVAARFDGFDTEDSPALTGMDEPSPSADLGLGITGSFDHLNVGLTVLTDILDESGGHQVDLKLGFPIKARQWTLEPSLLLEYWSDELVDHYYGVSPAEARAGRPAYEGTDTVNAGAGFQVRRRWETGWMFLLRTKWTRFGDTITDSPIVSDDGALTGFVGTTYTF